MNKYTAARTRGFWVNLPRRPVPVQETVTAPRSIKHFVVRIKRVEDFSRSCHRSVLNPGEGGPRGGPRGGRACTWTCRGEQLEHLQPSPLTAAEHMAGPR